MSRKPDRNAPTVVDVGTLESTRESPQGLEAARTLRHDLKTPLNQIIGYSEMLQEDAIERGERGLSDDLKKIELAGRELLDMINALQFVGNRVSTASSIPAAERRRTVVPKFATSFEGRLLVVDDDARNRDVLARRLQSRGAMVQVAPSGEVALEMIQGGTFDLIVLDVVMPGMSGLEVLTRIREQAALEDLPVIMATARDASEDVVLALEKGANDYVTKPLDFSVVLARVATQLALKRARDRVKVLDERLAQAQQRITDLASAAPSDVQGVRSWVRPLVYEVAEAIGARMLEVFLYEGQDLISVNDGGIPVPGPEQMASLTAAMEPALHAGGALWPIPGPTGKLFGCLFVSDPAEQMETNASRMIVNLARQLGGALELSATRQELQVAAEARRASRAQMLEQGIDLLHICRQCGLCFDHTQTMCSKDGGVLSAPHLFPLCITGRYRLKRRVGEGGMGTVFRALDLRLQRDVAVKVIRREHFNDERVRRRFEQEARTVAKLDHPGVVSVFDSGELEDGSLFIVMEWLEGADLGQLMSRSGAGTPAQVVEMLRQVSEALLAAQEASLVHRDIKPANIFITPLGEGFRAKLLDFGVAKNFSRDSDLTETGRLVGTPLYMSPEQFLGRPLDARSDLYSLASVAFLALTGTRIVKSNDLAHILMETVTTECPRLSSVLPAVSQAIDDGFAAGLAKDPDHRPPTACRWLEAFARELERVAATVPGWQLDLVDSSPQTEPEPESLLSSIDVVFDDKSRQ